MFLMARTAISKFPAARGYQCAAGTASPALLSGLHTKNFGANRQCRALRYPIRGRMDQHTVLVVEDEFFIREDVCAHLEERGFNVLNAASADEALNTLLARADVDLVFTDVRMPGSMDGLQLARWVLDHRPNIAVIIASGDTGRVVAMRELCGAHAFTKPYSFDEVVTKMLHLIGSQRASSP